MTVPGLEDTLRVVENLREFISCLLTAAFSNQRLSLLQTAADGMRVVVAKGATSIGHQLSERRGGFDGPSGPGRKRCLGAAYRECVRIIRAQTSLGVRQGLVQLPLCLGEIAVQAKKPDKAAPGSKNLRVVRSFQP